MRIASPRANQTNLNHRRTHPLSSKVLKLSHFGPAARGQSVETCAGSSIAAPCPSVCGGKAMVTKRLLIIASAATLAAGCQSAPQDPTLEEVRSVAERYRDVNVAIAEGYKTDNKC